MAVNNVFNPDRLLCLGGSFRCGTLDPCRRRDGGPCHRTILDSPCPRGDELASRCEWIFLSSHVGLSAFAVNAAGCVLCEIESLVDSELPDRAVIDADAAREATAFLRPIETRVSAVAARPMDDRRKDQPRVSRALRNSARR